MGDYSYCTPWSELQERYAEEERKEKEIRRVLFFEKKDSAKSKLLQEISSFKNTGLNLESDLMDFRSFLVSNLENTLSEISGEKFLKAKIGKDLINIHKDILAYNNIVNECLKDAVNWSIFDTKDKYPIRIF